MTTSYQPIKELQDFVDYVFDFYGAEDAVYPMGATKTVSYTHLRAHET